MLWLYIFFWIFVYFYKVLLINTLISVQDRSLQMSILFLYLCFAIIIEKIKQISNSLSSLLRFIFFSKHSSTNINKDWNQYLISNEMENVINFFFVGYSIIPKQGRVCNCFFNRISRRIFVDFNLIVRVGIIQLCFVARILFFPYSDSFRKRAEYFSSQSVWN